MCNFNHLYKKVNVLNETQHTRQTKSKQKLRTALIYIYYINDHRNNNNNIQNLKRDQPV